MCMLPRGLIYVLRFSKCVMSSLCPVDLLTLLEFCVKAQNSLSLRSCCFCSFEHVFPFLICFTFLSVFGFSTKVNASFMSPKHLLLFMCASICFELFRYELLVSVLVYYSWFPFFGGNIELFGKEATKFTLGLRLFEACRGRCCPPWSPVVVGSGLSKHR